MYFGEEKRLQTEKRYAMLLCNFWSFFAFNLWDGHYFDLGGFFSRFAKWLWYISALACQLVCVLVGHVLQCML